MEKLVLIADENTIIREVVKESLQIMTSVRSCSEASNGREAVERALECKPDLIILDLLMPEMNGAEAAQLLKASMPEVPIVLFTMVAEDWMKEIGVDAVVSKPEGLTRLAECVDRLLSRVP